MFIPKTKYSKPRHSPGKDFLLNGKVYVGWYIELSTGEFYTGKVFDSKSVKLESLKNTTVEISYPFHGVEVSPSTKDRENKVWSRYFLQDKRNSKIIEVDKQRYDLFKVKPYVTRGAVNWILQGPVDNLMINGYQYYGAAHKNKLLIEGLEKTMPGILNFIKDYGQFVE